MSESISVVKDGDVPELKFENVLDGFGFHICTAEVPELENKTALLFTPIDPTGGYCYTFVMSAEMIGLVVQQLQSLQGEVTYTADDVIARMQPILDASVQEGSVH